MVRAANVPVLLTRSDALMFSPSPPSLFARALALCSTPRESRSAHSCRPSHCCEVEAAASTSQQHAPMRVRRACDSFGALPLRQQHLVELFRHAPIAAASAFSVLFPGSPLVSCRRLNHPSKRPRVSFTVSSTFETFVNSPQKKSDGVEDASWRIASCKGWRCVQEAGDVRNPGRPRPQDRRRTLLKKDPGSL